MLLKFKHLCFSWSTHWFRVKFTLPENWLAEVREDEEVLFYWNTQSEATIWDEKGGQPIGAFSTGAPHGDIREYYLVSPDMINNNR